MEKVAQSFTSSALPTPLDDIALAPLAPQLSIVMPVYNEAGGIADVVAEMAAEVLDRIGDAELVLVDDASTDATPGILDDLAAFDARVKVHHAAQNGGHGPALRRALDESAGDWIFQIDSDGQQLASEFWKLWQRRHEADLVMGVRPINRNGRHRILVSLAARYVNKALGGGSIRDVNVPFKLFRRTLWEDLRDEIPATPMVPSLLITLGAGIRGWRIAQTPISSLPRQHGSSTVNVPALVRLCRGALSEVVAFRRALRRRGRVVPALEPQSPAMSESSWR
jgi:dolichol-phosphate mannosyltransferase